jgi:hypothetical protein
MEMMDHLTDFGQEGAAPRCRDGETGRCRSATSHGKGTKLALNLGETPRESEQEGVAMAYYTNVGPLSGPLVSRAGYFAIVVLPARQSRTPIGQALAAGQDNDGLALWRLTVETIELPGLWVVVDREFRHTGQGSPRAAIRPAQESRAHPPVIDSRGDCGTR